MSKFRLQHVKNYNHIHTPASDLREKLGGLVLVSYIWDNDYWYVTHEDWGEIFADVLMNQPKYSMKFDCENFAMLTTCRVLEKYGLNTCGICVGDSPMGYHGFNIFLSDKGLFYLEPQTSMVYSVKEDSGYQPHVIILG